MNNAERTRKAHIQLGYRVVWDQAHPLSDKRGRVLEHRKIMFDIFGWGPHPCFYCHTFLPFRTGRKRKGLLGIEIDHLDGDRANNDPLNMVFTCTGCNTRKSQKGNHRAAAVARVA